MMTVFCMSPHCRGEEARRAAVGAFGTDDMVTSLEQGHHSVDRSHPGSKGQALLAAFEHGHVALKRRACGIARAGIFVSFMLAEFFLNVGRGLEDGDDDGPGRGVRFLPCVNGVGLKAHDEFLL